MHPVSSPQNVHRPDSAGGVDMSTGVSSATPRLTNRELASSLLSHAHSRGPNADQDTAGERSNAIVSFISTCSHPTPGNSADAAQATLPDPGRRNSEDDMPLCLAAGKGDLEGIKGLVASGADAGKADRQGWTPLMCAARRGHAEVVNFFLSQNVDAAASNNDGWNALMIATYHGHRPIATTLIDAQSSGQESGILETSLIAASRLNETALMHALVLVAQGSSRQLDSPDIVRWAIQNNMQKSFFEALGDADLMLSAAQYVSIVATYGLSTTDADCLREMMDENTLSRLTAAALAYTDDKHFEVDNYLGHPAPDASRGNALGMATQGIAQFANVRHCTNAAGQYRHAICMMREEAPRPELLFPVDGMLLMGWRSRITQLVNEAQKDAERAASRAAALLAGQQGRIVLTDASANIMASGGIQFRETLFAFQLGRNEHLNQLAVPPKAPPDGAQEATSAEAATNAGNHRLAMQVQAQALLALNKTYEPLRLHMPSSAMPWLSRSEAIEAEAGNGKRISVSGALAEIRTLIVEAEQLFEKVMETEQGLVQHWFLDELTRLLDEMGRSHARMESMMSDA